MYVGPREVLNKLKWKPGESIADAIIYYIDYGAPNDSTSMSGSEITKLEGYYLEAGEDSFIPYHRVYRIDYRGKVIYWKPGYKDEERKYAMFAYS
jgi:uncharacterized protein (UPF0248 family)